MSSAPFKTGLRVIDSPRFGYPNHFILRATSQKAAERKIRDIAERETNGTYIHIFEYGFRPDHPIPVAMYFCEIEIRRESGRNGAGRKPRFV